jgi:hypothetical protein
MRPMTEYKKSRGLRISPILQTGGYNDAGIDLQDQNERCDLFVDGIGAIIGEANCYLQRDSLGEKPKWVSLGEALQVVDTKEGRRNSLVARCA